jgi:hypothetical protein
VQEHPFHHPLGEGGTARSGAGSGSRTAFGGRE